jgi:hypothetical protein
MRPFVKHLAEFRGISYEEAEKQLAVDFAEAVITKKSADVPLVFAVDPMFEASPFPPLLAEAARRQALIDATEKRMVEGPPPSPEFRELADILEKTPLQAQTLFMTQQDLDDIMAWSKDNKE